jgi:hypothetical protein
MTASTFFTSFDRVVQLDAGVFQQVGGVALDAVGAGGDVRTAALENRDDTGAGNVILRLRVVQGFCEGDDVGGVEADETDADVGGAQGGGEQHRE